MLSLTKIFCRETLQSFDYIRISYWNLRSPNFPNCLSYYISSFFFNSHSLLSLNQYILTFECCRSLKTKKKIQHENESLHSINHSEWQREDLLERNEVKWKEMTFFHSVPRIISRFYSDSSVLDILQTFHKHGWVIWVGISPRTMGRTYMTQTSWQSCRSCVLK